MLILAFFAHVWVWGCFVNITCMSPKFIRTNRLKIPFLLTKIMYKSKKYIKTIDKPNHNPQMFYQQQHYDDCPPKQKTTSKSEFYIKIAKNAKISNANEILGLDCLFQGCHFSKTLTLDCLFLHFSNCLKETISVCEG